MNRDDNLVVWATIALISVKKSKRSYTLCNCGTHGIIVECSLALDQLDFMLISRATELESAKCYFGYSG